MATDTEKMNIEKFSEIAAGIPVAKAANYRAIYCNSTRMAISPWDVRFTFGQVLEGDNGAQVNQDEITILISPAHAKVVLRNLEKTITQYEETFGVIPDPLGALKSKKTILSKKKGGKD